MPQDSTPSPASSSPHDPITCPGDLWTAGRHRLMCANADDTNAIDRLMGATTEPMIVEPPWPVANTLIACEVLGSHCYAVVTDAQAIDTAIKRWQHFTGQQVTHADTGAAFEEPSS